MNNSEFDDIIRQTMQNGAEEVPAGLWASVEGRLAAAGAASGAGFRLFLRKWGWAVVSAACACVLASVILFNGKDSSSPVMADEVYVCESLAKDIPANDDDRNISTPDTAEQQSIRYAAFENHLPISAEPQQSEQAQPYGPQDPDLQQQSETCSESPRQPSQPSGQNSPVFAESQDFPDFDEPVTVLKKRTPFALTASLSSGGNTGNSSSGAARHSRSSYNCGADGKLTESQGTFYMLPLRAGIGVRFNIGHNFAIGTGLNYTFLTRRLKGNYDCGAVESYACDNITNNQHYIGIPLDFYYNFVNREKFTVYASAGVSAEKCVSNSYRFTINYSQPDLKGSFPKKITEKVNGLQVGINIGLGIQYNFSKFFSLYLDPYASWYIPNYQQPKSIRTVQPLQLGAELGVRFNL